MATKKPTTSDLSVFLFLHMQLLLRQCIFIKYEFCRACTFIVLLICSAINKAVFFLQFLCWHIRFDRIQSHCSFLFIFGQLDNFIKYCCCHAMSLIFR